jgi:peptide/nickel transport system substrate-binding protein
MHLFVLSRKVSLLGRTGAALLLMLAQATNPAAAQTAAPPVRGGTLVVALGANPDHLNLAISSSVPVALPAQSVIEGLVRLDGAFAPQPALATSWTVSSDDRTITFRLREGVTWHDGRPFTSSDVKYSFDNLTKLHARAAAMFKSVASVEAPDDRTIVVRLAQPSGTFLAFLTADNAGILPRHLYEGTDPLRNPANQRPIGTGPFKFQSWAPGQSITMVRNDDYWEKGRPYLDRLIFRILPDANARVLALEAGEVDLITNYDMTVTDIERLKRKSGIVVRQKGGIPRPLLLIFNNKSPPLDDPRVRKALFRGLDRQLIKDNAYAGEGDVGRSAIPPGLAWAYNPAVDYMKSHAFDPRQAAQELDQAGFPRQASGQRFSLRFTYDPAQGGFAEIGEILRDNWRNLGVQVVLEPRERNVWLDTVYTKKEFHLTIAWYLAGVDPAIGVDRAYLCSDIRPAAFTNGSQYCNPELDALMQQARTTVDREVRAKAYRDAQIIIERDLPTAVLMESPHAQVVNSRVGNLDLLFEFSNEVNARFAEAFISPR